MPGIEAEAMLRRQVLALLGLGAAVVAASAVVLPSDVEAQTAGMQRRQARRAGRRRGVRRGAQVHREASATTRGGTGSAGFTSDAFAGISGLTTDRRALSSQKGR